MFDYAVSPPKSDIRPRYATATVSAVAHVLVLGFAIGLPILYASDALPEPPDMMAFIVAAPPPPPPPPPPAPPPPEVKKAEAPKPTAREIPVAKPTPAATPPASVAAPTEAPAEVRPETGNEGAPAPTRAIDAGFEKGVAGGIEGGVPGGVAGGIETAVAPPPPPPPPPPAPKPQGPVRVGGQVKAPSLINRVNPTYPPMAQTAQVSGAVVLEATVSKSGRVENVRVVNGHPMLQASAVAAVKQWAYEPLRLNGEAVPFILTVTVTFTMPR
jgi:periplasmic protein TonB